MTAVAGAEPGISNEALFEKVGFKPHSTGQKDYLLSKARFNIPCCGRRWGKSQAAGHRMTYKSFVPESWNWIIGTSYRIGEKEFRVVWDDYQKLDLLRYCKKAYSQHQGDMYIKTPWGSTVMVVSADNKDSLLGEGLSHVIMSEAAKHSRDTWEQYIEPALSDLRGSADFPSTPQGFNWFHGLYMMGQLADIQPPSYLSPVNANKLEQALDYKSWQFPTWENSVRYPGGYNDPEIQRVMRTVSPVWFDQEYGAKFTALAGAIYDEWDDKRHVIDHYEFHPDWPNYLAFDYGFSNPTVCLDIQVSPSDDVVVWREYYSSGLATPVHAFNLRTREQPKGYHVDGMYGDPRGPDEAAIFSYELSSLPGDHGGVLGQDVRWKLSVEQIKRMLAHKPAKLQVVRGCTNLVRQMNNLHVKDQAKQAKQDLQEFMGDGNIQHKVDDHAADALRYFIGPYYVAGGNMHFSDLYGEEYRGSESESFALDRLTDSVILDDTFRVTM